MLTYNMIISKYLYACISIFGFYIQNYVPISLITVVVFYQSDMFSSVDTTATVNQPAVYQYHMHGMNDIFLFFFRLKVDFSE